MTSLTLDLPTELVERLQQAAERAGQPLMRWWLNCWPASCRTPTSIQMSSPLQQVNGSACVLHSVRPGCGLS